MTFDQCLIIRQESKRKEFFFCLTLLNKSKIDKNSIHRLSTFDHMISADWSVLGKQKRFLAKPKGKCSSNRERRSLYLALYFFYSYSFTKCQFKCQ